jgi:hypothetical protein
VDDEGTGVKSAQGEKGYSFHEHEKRKERRIGKRPTENTKSASNRIEWRSALHWESTTSQLIPNYDREKELSLRRHQSTQSLPQFNECSQSENLLPFEKDMADAPEVGNLVFIEPSGKRKNAREYI